MLVPSQASSLLVSFLECLLSSVFDLIVECCCYVYLFSCFGTSFWIYCAWYDGLGDEYMVPRLLSLLVHRRATSLLVHPVNVALHLRNRLLFHRPKIYPFIVVRKAPQMEADACYLFKFRKMRDRLLKSTYRRF